MNHGYRSAHTSVLLASPGVVKLEPCHDRVVRGGQHQGPATHATCTHMHMPTDMHTDMHT